MLKLLESTLTSVSLSNKLVELAIDADDANITNMANYFATNFRPYIGSKGNDKFRPLSLV